MWQLKKPNFQTKRIKGSKLKRGRKPKNSEEKSLLNKIKTNAKNVKYIGVFAITIVLTTFVYFQDQNPDWFKASLLEGYDVPAFDGTALPITTTLNLEGWTNYKESSYNDVPSNLFIPAPSYDLNILNGQAPVWGVSNENHYVTWRFFGVVFGASYSTPHTELSGNHFAVDVIANRGTPIHAIANGLVVKVEHSNTGFGNHVVIEHEAPHPTTGELITLLSSYSHMDRMDVEVGDEVKKGQIIGTVGDTGTASTNHLHFAIETERPAGWYPGWFNDPAEGLKYTINPWLYVEKHLNHTPGNDSYIPTSTNQNNSVNTNTPQETTIQTTQLNNTGDEVVSVIEIIEEDATQETQESESIAIDTTSEESPEYDQSFTFSFKEDYSTNLVGSNVTITVKDQFNQLANLPDDYPIEVKLKEGETIGKIIHAPKTKADFNQNREATITVEGIAEGTTHVVIGRNEKAVHFAKELGLTSKIRFENDNEYTPGINEPILLQATDFEGRDTPIVQVGGVLNLNITSDAPEKVVLDPPQINFSDFVDGKARVNLKVLDESAGEIVIEAKAGVTVFGESDPIKPGKSIAIFPDVPPTDVDYEAIQALNEWGIINGYPNGRYEPNKAVDRVEAVHIVMKAFGKTSDQSSATVNLPWPDTDGTQWYARSLNEAYKLGVVSGDDLTGNFRPTDGVIGPELLKMVFETTNIKPNMPLSENPHPRVNANVWFAGYWQMAEDMNIFPELENDNYSPTKPLTRREVAKVVYRLKKALESNILVYGG